jgi:hypothetical protein
MEDLHVGIRKELEWKKSWIFNLLATEALNLRAKDL